MHRLAIEMSAGLASLALTEGPTCRAAFAWSQKQVPHQHLFGVLPGFLKDAGLTPAAIGHLIVGLGPGAFSGIRIALAAANGLALPGGVPVHGLPSAMALAWDQFTRTDAAEVVVLGDARRNRCWLAHYGRGGPTGIVILAEPALVPLAELAPHIPAAACVATPDWERLRPVLETAIPPHATLLRAPCYPSARALAELADRHQRADAPLHPPQPIYLHPAV